MPISEIEHLGTQTMVEEMGPDVVKSRVRCATLALGTVQAAVAEYLRESARNELARRMESGNLASVESSPK
jgi:nitrogen fixation NifU-like protein